MKPAINKIKALCSNCSKYNVTPFVAILFTPIILLIFFPYIFFNELSWIDPYIYIGYGYNYGEPSFLTGYYKGSRLPYVLVQYFFRTVFNPAISGYLIHFVLYASSLYFLFHLAKKISNKFSAYLITLYAPIIFISYSGGADYHNVFSGLAFIAMVYYVVSKTLAKEDQEWEFFFNTGILYAIVVHSNILMSLDAAIYSACLYLGIRISQDRKINANIIKKVPLVIAGFIFITLILCLINYGFGRHFMFMKPLWSFALSGGDNKLYWTPLENFIAGAKHLSCFAALFIFSLFLTAKIALKKDIKKYPLIFFANISFILVFLEMVVTYLLRINNPHMFYFTFPTLVAFIITLLANLGLIKSEKLFTNKKGEFLDFTIVAVVFLITLFIAKITQEFFLANIIGTAFISCFILWLILFGTIFLIRDKINNYKKFVIFTTFYFLITNSYGNLFYSKSAQECNVAKSATDFYIEFNNHVKQYKLGKNRHDLENIFSWMNTQQPLKFNQKCSQFYDNKLFNLGMGTFAGSSGYAVPLDNIWQEGGMNQIENLWQNQKEEYFVKPQFFAENQYPRVLILLTYDKNDALKMIEKMKNYKINFSISEERILYTKAFEVKYFILTEDGFRK